MAAEVFVKSTGESRTVLVDAIDLDAPSVVRLQLSRTDVQNIERQGNDLLIELRSGETIRIVDFYIANGTGETSDVVLQEADGRMWLARSGATPQFFELAKKRRSDRRALALETDRSIHATIVLATTVCVTVMCYSLGDDF